MIAVIMLPMIVSCRRYLIHHRLQFIVMVLRRVYSVRMQRMEVMCLICRRVELAVEQTRRQHGVQGIVAVTSSVRGVLRAH